MSKAINSLLYDSATVESAITTSSPRTTYFVNIFQFLRTRGAAQLYAAH